MIQRHSASFRGFPENTVWDPQNFTMNLIERFPPTTNPGWTLGATLIDVVQLVPPMVQRWTVQQLSITAEIVIFMPSLARALPYGKYGKIFAGLTIGITQTKPAIPVTTGVFMPTDRSAITALWDPANDPLPPLSSAGDTVLQQAVTISPPQPLPIDQGETFGVGLWMLPSLLGQPDDTQVQSTLAIRNASYSISYDDGVPPPPVY